MVAVELELLGEKCVRLAGIVRGPCNLAPHDLERAVRSSATGGWMIGGSAMSSRGHTPAIPCRDPCRARLLYVSPSD